MPNIACALLFALDPRDVLPGCRIRFLRFDGEHEGTGAKWNATKDLAIDGTVPEIIDETDKIISDQIRTFSRLGEGQKFYTQPEYPQRAWYEAIVNACVHRSYGNGLVTPKNIYNMHQPRNPDLMEALRHMDLVKCAHEGTRRMRDTMTEMSLPSPEFEEREVGHPIFSVTLRNNVHQRKAWVDRDVTELVGTVLATSLKEREKRILNFAAEHGLISVSDAARIAECAWPTAKRAITRLVNMGVLESTKRRHKKHDTTARYRLSHPKPLDPHLRRPAVG